MSSIKDFELAQRIHIATVTLQAEIVTLRNAAVLATELAEKAESRIAALEAERDCANDRAATHLADAYSMRGQRDALQKNCTALVQMFELAVSIPTMSDEQLRQLVANGKAAIDAARSKP